MLEDILTSHGVTFHWRVGLLTYSNIAIDLKRVVAIRREPDDSISFLFDGAEQITWYMPFETVFEFWKQYLELQAAK